MLVALFLLLLALLPACGKKAQSPTAEGENKNQPPTVRIIAPTEGMQFNAGTILYFYATAKDPEGEPLNYTWDFGDGDFSHEVNPAKAYRVGGDYTVTLTVADPQQAQATTSITLHIVELLATEPEFRMVEPQPLVGTRTAFADSDVAILFALDEADSNELVCRLAESHYEHYLCYRGVVFNLENGSGETILLIWDESAIIIKGIAKRIMHTGVKYIDRARSQPPSVIPPESSLRDGLWPIANVEYSNTKYEWKHVPEILQRGETLGVLLTLKIGESLKRYSFTFEYK